MEVYRVFLISRLLRCIRGLATKELREQQHCKYYFSGLLLLYLYCFFATSRRIASGANLYLVSEKRINMKKRISSFETAREANLQSRFFDLDAFFLRQASRISTAMEESSTPRILFRAFRPSVYLRIHPRPAPTGT